MEHYIKDVLGLDVVLENKDFKLPIYLKEVYNIKLLKIIDKEFVLLSAIENLPNASNLIKHIRIIEEKTNMTALILLKSITPYQRKKFIQEKIQFIVPNNQLFLPYCGIDLREKMNKAAKTPKRFSTKTQLLFIALCHNNAIFDMSYVDIAKELHFNKMDITRAVKELIALGLISEKKIGTTKKIIPLFKGKDLYEKGKVFLISPISKIVIAKKEDVFNGCEAGIYALAKKTMLSYTEKPIYAVSKKYNKSIKTYEKEYLNEPEMCVVELWKYDPCLFAGNNNIVDCISLAASLKHEKDERVQMSIDQMIEECKW